MPRQNIRRQKHHRHEQQQTSRKTNPIPCRRAHALGIRKHFKNPDDQPAAERLDRVRVDQIDAERDSPRYCGRREENMVRSGGQFPTTSTRDTADRQRQNVPQSGCQTQPGGVK